MENIDFIYHPVLKDHYNIAWDVDATLIGGNKSLFWRRWLRENVNRNHWIVTFRTDEALEQVWYDLSSCDDPIEKHWFEALYSIPKDLAYSYTSLHQTLKGVISVNQVTPKIKRIIACSELTLEEVIDINNKARFWKAKVCKEIGATVLVEDLESFCKPGCDYHGIVFVNSLKG